MTYKTLTVMVACILAIGIQSAYATTIHPQSPCNNGCGYEGNNPDSKLFANGYIEDLVDGVNNVIVTFKDPNGVIVYQASLIVDSNGRFDNEFDNPFFIRNMGATGTYTTIYQYADMETSYTWSYKSGMQMLLISNPSITATVEDNTLGGKQIRLIGENFGSNRETNILIKNPINSTISDLTQLTSNTGALDILVILDNVPMTGAYSIFINNIEHDFYSVLNYDIVETPVSNDTSTTSGVQPSNSNDNTQNVLVNIEQPIIQISNGTNWDQYILSLSIDDRLQLIKAVFKYLFQ